MKLNLIFAIIGMLFCRYATGIAYGDDTYRALAEGADFEENFLVIDDDGSPVSGVDCSGWIYLERHPDHGVGYKLCTDSNGRVKVSGRCGEWFRFIARKDGYYKSSLEVKYPCKGVKRPIADGAWQSDAGIRTVVLRRIKNLGSLSVPDLSRSVRSELKIPEFNRWIPFDLEKFDWSRPYGTGEHPDVLLRFGYLSSGRYYDYASSMEICFTNNQYAGAYIMEKDRMSDFKTAYSADTNAIYKSYFLFKNEKKRGQKTIADYLESDSYLVFRTRTTVDVNGDLQGACYGMISGPWMSGKDAMTFADGCFNQIRNDTDIEDGYHIREVVGHSGD